MGRRRGRGRRRRRLWFRGCRTIFTIPPPLLLLCLYESGFWEYQLTPEVELHGSLPIPKDLDTILR